MVLCGFCSVRFPLSHGYSAVLCESCSCEVVWGPFLLVPPEHVADSSDHSEVDEYFLLRTDFCSPGSHYLQCEWRNKGQDFKPATVRAWTWSINAPFGNIRTIGVWLPTVIAFGQSWSFLFEILEFEIWGFGFWMTLTKIQNLKPQTLNFPKNDHCG